MKPSHRAPAARSRTCRRPGGGATAAWPLAAVTSNRSGAAAKPCHRSSSLPAPAGPALGTGAGHSVRPGDGRLGRAGTPSRSIRPRACELPAPSAAKLPPRCGVPAGVRLLDCIIVYSAVSSTPMTDGRHALRRAGARAFAYRVLYMIMYRVGNPTVRSVSTVDYRVHVPYIRY